MDELNKSAMEVFKAAFDNAKQISDDEPIMSTSLWQVAYRRANIFGKIKMLIIKYYHRIFYEWDTDEDILKPKIKGWKRGGHE